MTALREITKLWFMTNPFIPKVLAFVGGASALAGATTLTAGAAYANAPAPQAANVQASHPYIVGGAAADRSAVSYVDAHYKGTRTTLVLATEPDTERGKAVYDVRVVAPNGATYVVHVSRANAIVLSANKAEAQTSTRLQSGSPGAQDHQTPANLAGDR